jgi:hypothetical protein
MKTYNHFLLPVLALSFVCSAAASSINQTDNYQHATPGINNGSIPFPWSYLGCYGSKSSPPVLNSEAFTDHAMTEKKCVKRCSRLGYTFAGLKSGDKCHCGYAMSSFTVASTCNKPCAGASGERCGGSHSFDIFTNGLAPPTVKGWSTLGCYSENEDSRTLTGHHSISDHRNSVPHCISTCQKRGFNFTGVESGNECYCGNTVNREAAPIPGSQFCSTPCTGNKTEMCGGDNSLNLYTSTGPKGPACSYNETGAYGCPSDVPYLDSNGAAFCTSYISYVPPTSTETFTTTPATSTILQTTTVRMTITVTATSMQTITTTSTVTQNQMRALARRTAQRAVETPEYVSTWAPARISAACSSVATGTVTTKTTQTAPVPSTTQVATNTITDSQTATITLTTTTTAIVTATACPSSPVANGGFESSFSYWTVYNPINGEGGSWSIQQSPDSSHGAYVAQVTLRNPDTSKYGGFLGYISQTITTCAKFSYSMTFDYRCTVIDQGAYVEPSVSDGNTYGGAFTCAQTDVWYQASLVWSSSTTSTDIFVNAVQNGVNQAVFQIDNVLVKKGNPV